MEYFCERCQSCIDGSAELYGGKVLPEGAIYIHHVRTSELLSALKQRCRGCTTLWEACSTSEQAVIEALSDEWCDVKLKDEVPFMTCYITSVENVVKSTLFPDPQPDLYSMLFIIAHRIRDLFENEKSEPSAWFVFQPSAGLSDDNFGHVNSESTASEEAWETACKWLSGCRDQHTTCNDSMGTDWMPTRLLDVSFNADLDHDTIRLVLTKDLRPMEAYVTLSHCWGEAKFLKLERTTIEAMLSGVAIQDLPQTFRDAVSVVRRLGIKYLWIDSLCIIQHDRADWLAESVLMEKVYSSAFCNIAATASSDGSQGLFRDRKPSLLHRLQIQADFKAIMGDGEVQSRLFTMFNGKYWEHELNNAPLNKRAWVMQERLLARRVLHYNQKELMWECREHSASEAYPHGFPFLIGSTALKNLDPHSARTKSLHRDVSLGRSSGVYALWASIQQFYSSCKLTYPEDRLIALSGVAKRFEVLADDVYVAGMWRKVLAQQILWSTGNMFEPNVTRELPAEVWTQYIAPSFSWASTDSSTRIAESFDESQLLISVDHINVESVNGDATGLLRSASLQLHGTLKVVEFIKRVYPDETYSWLTYVGGNKVCHTRYSPHVLTDKAGRDLAILCKARKMFYMPARRYTLPNDPAELLLGCLMLELLDSETGTYRRLGMMEFSKGSMIPQLLAVQEDEHLLPCLSYSPKAERPHVVRLV